MARTTGKKRGFLLNTGNSFNFGTGAGGTYSTAEGKVMSGTNPFGSKGSGYGEFGTTDTEIGKVDPKTGKTTIYEPYQSAHGKSGESTTTFQANVPGYSGEAPLGYSTTKSKSTTPSTPAGMPEVTVGTGGGKGGIMKRAATAKGSPLTARQKKRLSKGGPKARRQYERIQAQAARKARRAR